MLHSRSVAPIHRLRQFFRHPAVLALSVVGLCFAADMLLTPTVAYVRTSNNGGTAKNVSLPLNMRANSGSFAVTIGLHLSPLQKRSFVLRGNSCGKNRFLVNNIPVNAECNDSRPLKMESYLRTGLNVLRMEMTLKEHKKVTLDLAAAPRKTGMLAGKAFVAVLLLACTYFLSRRPLKNDEWLLSLLIFGSVLRIIYLLATPAWLRGYDTAAHLEYVDYLGTHLSLPPAALGWETHQPPLFYVLLAPVAWVVRSTGILPSAGTEWMQMICLAIALATLAIALKTAVVISEGRHRAVSLLFGSIVAAFPALVLSAPRINNDVLVQLLGFLFFLLLLQWWRTPTKKLTAGVLLTLGLAMLTKGNGLLFTAIFLCCALCRPAMKLRHKASVLALAALCVVLFWEVPNAVRMQASRTTRMHNPGAGMNESLVIRNSAASVLTFRPTEILRHPWADTREDKAGRQYFWMFFFKSAFFGEFSFRNDFLGLARVMLVTGFGMLTVLTASFVAFLPQKNGIRFPVVTSFILLIAGALAYRFLSPPFSPNQDFRFSTVLVPVAAAVIASAFTDFPPRARRLTAVITGCFVVTSALFFLRIGLS
jgi:4-amino-4-deoxy-L-arabinose transferase-like glycosyltransferase